MSIPFTTLHYFIMPLSDRIRNVLSMSQLHSSASSDADDSSDSSPASSPVEYRKRTMTGNSSSSANSIIQAPVLCLKKTFSDLRGAVKRRREERYREAVALWAQADEREWEYPTWGGPAKKSRKYSREQRDSLRAWCWEKVSFAAPCQWLIAFLSYQSDLFNIRPIKALHLNTVPVVPVCTVSHHVRRQTIPFTSRTFLLILRRRPLVGKRAPANV